MGVKKLTFARIKVCLRTGYNTMTGKETVGAPRAEAGRTYTVVHGDSLWNIAEKLLGKGSRYTEIVKLNGLKSNVLKSGQVLEIPEK